MAEPTTVSILIANFNYGRYLPDAIDSALAQTRQPVQVIVVDDGSTDESTLVIQTYGDKIDAIYQENSGQASALNAGFERVTGQTVILLDADDVLEPTAVEQAIGFFDDPAVVKVCWPHRVIDQRNELTGEVLFTNLSSGSFRKHALDVGPANHLSCAHSGNFWRKTYLDAIFPIPVDDFRNVVDSYLFTFVPFFGDVRTLPDPLTRYRVHGSNVSASAGAGFRRENWERRARHLQTLLSGQGETVTIEGWRRRSSYYRKLNGILRGEAKIGDVVPAGVPIALLGNHLFHPSDICPARPVLPAPAALLAPQRTREDFQTYLTELSEAGIGYLVIQGPWVAKGTALDVLTRLLESEHEILFDDRWIVIARLRPTLDVDIAADSQELPVIP